MRLRRDAGEREEFAGAPRADWRIDTFLRDPYTRLAAPGLIIRRREPSANCCAGEACMACMSERMDRARRRIDVGDGHSVADAGGFGHRA
jgi:hypothetical protein